MKDWEPERYLKFANERTRPVQELIAEITVNNPRHITDLGCGPGNSTKLICQRWPDADVTGVDNSPSMLKQAKTTLPGCDFTNANINQWQPLIPQDVILANSCLQWLVNHDALLPRFVAQLATGGTLAIQMPDNLREPSHTLLRETARQLGFHDASRVPLPSAEHYYNLLNQAGCRVNIWRTTYYHPLAGSDGIIDWLQGTGLRPFLDGLSANESADFLNLYRTALDKAYPLQSDGQILLCFPRLFIIAQRI